MAKLDGKIAVITGGTTGIGAATAELFAREGATVIVTGQNARTIDEAKRHFDGRIEVVQSDAGDIGSTGKLFQDVGNRHGRVDVLFVNAGIAQFAPADQVDEAFFDRQFDINVKGAYFTIKHAAPLIPDRGSIILTGSAAASKGYAAGTVYSATKAALRSFARSFAAELASRQVRVNTLSPGPIETPIFGKMELPAEVKEQFGKMMHEAVPLKRFGSADEVAAAALFLASDDSAYVNGIDLAVDGGVTAV